MCVSQVWCICILYIKNNLLNSKNSLNKRPLGPILVRVDYISLDPIKKESSLRDDIIILLDPVRVHY